MTQNKGKEEIEEITRTGIRKHTETVSKYFDRHGRLYQSEESKCL